MLYGRQPWPCRDLNSYVCNMKNMSLRFPFEKPISEEMKDFIRRCLTVDENSRLGWDEVFNHPILKKQVNEREFVNNCLNDKVEEKIDPKTQ
jgi:calcium-dependent protein kinase